MASPLPTVARYRLPFLVVVIGQPLGRRTMSSISERKFASELYNIFKNWFDRPKVMFSQVSVRAYGGGTPLTGFVQSRFLGPVSGYPLVLSLVLSKVLLQVLSGRYPRTGVPLS